MVLESTDGRQMAENALRFMGECWFEFSKTRTRTTTKAHVILELSIICLIYFDKIRMIC